MPKLSIVIPVFNEEKTVGTLLAKVEAATLPSGWEKEMIVIDDASTDGTRTILNEFSSRLTIHFRDRNGGKGSAVRDGVGHATGDYILFQDADLEYEPNDIPALIGALSMAEVVYGSRNLRPRERRGAYIPRAGVWFLTQLINTLYGLRLTDVWTCYKLFPREAAGDLVPGRFESELLLTAALARRGYRFTEVPIAYHPREFGEGKKIRYRDGIYAIIAIVRDWLAHR